jgi:hypothetical protein
MQSLIHGNFEGAAQKKAYALVGASAAIAAAVGPLVGGFITTYLSWRIAFLLEDVIIVVVLSGIRLVRDAPYTGERHIDVVGAALSAVGMGGIVLSILVWQEGGEAVAALMVAGALSIAGLVYWLVSRKRTGKPDPARSRPVQVEDLPLRHHRTDAPADRARGHDDRAPDLLADGARVQRDASRPVSRAAVAHDVRDGTRRREASRNAAPEWNHPRRLRTRAGRHGDPGTDRARATSGWYLVIPLVIAGCGLGLLVSQLNNYTLAPISEERVSEAAGVNSAGGSFGLSFGLAFAGAIMLATLSFTFTRMTESSTVLPPAEKQQVAQALDDDAEIMSNTQLDEQLANQPEAIQDEIIRINTDARPRALQVALLVPILAAAGGLLNSFWMVREPDPTPSAAAEGMAFG